jgi:L-Lysine epsilon oxidase N-terminal/L-lysine epsilon oxidase C-terminal domain
MPTLSQVKIFPPIGIARIGNSPEWYFGPELPFPAPPPVPSDGKYKDDQCRVRRQAQRFRLWGYFNDGTNRELTATDGAIQWTVHLSNAKAVFQGEAGGLIDPGPRTLNGPNDTATFANGTYTVSGQTVEVPLGDASTDADGRLIVVGGFGTSGSPMGNSIAQFWQNPGWYDDVSDGPVNATITVGGQVFTAVDAWVICPPPRFAPSLYSPITLYDSIRQVAITQNLPGTPQPAATPSFVGDIWPILTRGIGMLRVEADTFGPGDHSSLSTVIPPGPGQDAARAAILSNLANPGGTDNVGQPNMLANMPLLNTGAPLGSDPADIPPTLRPFQYAQMAAWSAGNFVNDWPPVAPTTITPAGLTQAVLENCVGAPFFPGIEATVTVNDGSLTYTEAFRLDQTGLNPGDVTKGMARPWQADFTACSSGGPDEAAWWPAARPDYIYPQGSTTAVGWTRGIVTSAQDMVDNWFRLGFIIDPGNGQAVETERTVVCKDCFIITERDEIGEEEASALITANQQIIDAFYVVVEGFTPADLGITTPNPNSMQLQAWAPNITFNPTPLQMQQQVNDMLLEDNSALNQVQRITFGYNISFIGTNDFTSDVVPFELIANIQGLSSNATIDLTQVDSPYMDHGPISYLSDDTRVFKLQPGQSVVGAPALGTDPLGFIQGVLTHLRTGMTPAAAYSAFEALPSGENAADQLEWNPTLNMMPVFNFALCRVRYRATMTTAMNVRVFFRLFQTAATGTEYNSATTYRVGGHPGVKIPLLGIQGGELVTIPFFAEARKPANVNLNSQTDTNNIQNIAPAGGGKEAYMYYGCWLDINQPNDLRFPIQPSPPDGGPFTGTLLSIADLIRGTHQCMVTEISFDLGPAIPAGISTANCGSLSQRNLAIDNSDNPGSLDTHRVQHTFAIHPTTSTPLPKQGPDELMIAWGNTPVGSLATVYLPGVRVAEVLDLAARNFNLQTLERVDDHTLRCRTAGVTYIPIPAGGALDLAGLITLDLPASVRTGQNFHIVLRQVMDTPAPQPTIQQPVTPQAGVRSRRASKARAERGPTPSRHILGSFQFAVQVRTAKEMLPLDERNLTALERTAEKIPLENRWYPVFRRYISQLRGRVGALPRPGPGPGPGPGPERISYEGKVSGLLFDRFGDYEGFCLQTEDGERRFFSREKEIDELTERAWRERLRIEVWVERDALHRPLGIVVRGRPVPFHDG